MDEESAAKRQKQEEAGGVRKGTSNEGGRKGTSNEGEDEGEDVDAADSPRPENSGEQVAGDLRCLHSRVVAFSTLNPREQSTVAGCIRAAQSSQVRCCSICCLLAHAVISSADPLPSGRSHDPQWAIGPNM